VKLVLGIDPGSLNMGYGLVRSSGSKLEHVAHGCLRASRALAIAERLAKLHGELERILESYCPDAVAIEKVFTAKNPKSALMLGQARGAVLVAIGRRKLPLAEYAPAEVKLAVGGHGSCSKQQLARMAERIVGISLQGENSDASDALAIAICHAQALSREEWISRSHRA
jgi:crossover junction endodeoxyribonuclease RuvC